MATKPTVTEPTEAKPVLRPPEPAEPTAGRSTLAALGRVAARLARHVEVGLAKVDLSLPQYRILMLLDEGRAGASNLAEHLAVSRPTVTAVVDGLVARGLVDRSHDPGDRRRVDHILTEEGREVLYAADRIVDDRLIEIAEYLDDDAEIDQALRNLDSWRQALDRYRAVKSMSMRRTESA